jgi:hypothetical protein
MQKKSVIMGFVVLMTSTVHLRAEDLQQDSTFRRWYVGSSLFMFGNLDRVNNPEYVQLNVGYRITQKDVVSVEFKRSIYAWPLGIPFGPSFDAPGLNYPGHARILAPTVGYQRFWWKGVYTSVYALNAFEKYMNEDKKRIGNGYTLYLNFHLGYQFRFWENRIFFEPAMGCSYWPVRAHVPEAFNAVERQWPDYFIQPGLHFGFNF